VTRLETARLILRPWEPRDRAPFAALNADPEVRAHYPNLLTRAESDAQLARMHDAWAAGGFSFAAAERKADGAFVGLVGIAPVRFPEVPALADAVEVGWRLARAHWGEGYATEAARAWLAHGFGTLGLSEIVAFTVPANIRSQAVMRRLGMRHDPARDFLHPAIPEGHPLRQHVLFAIAGTGSAIETGGGRTACA
jgi:ribosomal-protein-alanine N-acetyltransferase